MLRLTHLKSTPTKMLAAVVATLAMVIGLLVTATTPAIAAAAAVSTVSPAPDVLDVDFASGAPVDHAQNLVATTVGAPTVATDATLGTKVATFNGSADAYQYDFTSQYSKLTTALTVECQFRWNGAALSTLSSSAFPSICSGEQSGGVAIEVYGNKLNADIYVGGYKYAYASSTAVVPGIWYDAVATWDGQNITLYLNGQPVATTAAAGTMTVPSTASQKWTLGADTSSSGGIEAPAPVSLAVSRMWSTALSAAQVAALYGGSSNAVTVTKSGQGTATASTVTAKAGDTVTLTQTAATGYHFTGWQVTAPNDGSVSIADNATFTMPSAPVTVQATFAPNTYTVHYDGNGASGGAMTDGAFTYDQAAALAANAFTRTGYTFIGWATTAAGSANYSDGASVSNLTATNQGTVTLYAVWHATVSAGTVVPAPDVLNVDFATGAPVDHAQSLAATTVGAPSVATDSTLGTKVATFNGSTDAYQYNFSSQFSKLTKALTIECQFRWNGAALSTLSSSAFPSICSGEQSGGVNIEVYANKLNASIYVGGYKYAYASATAVVPGTWYDAIATWDGANLKFYLNGQLVATTAASGTMTVPSTAAQKWSLGADTSSTGGIEAAAPVSLATSRIWTTALSAAQVTAQSAAAFAQPVNVTKSGQGTASAAPSTARVGDTVTLSQTAGAGYHFAGWQVSEPSDGSVLIGTDGTFTMPARPVTVTASFTPNAYTVHYDGNGADGGAMADQPFTYDQAGALRTNAFSRAGSDFAGWATSATGRPVYADAASVSDLSATDGATVTLYALWVPTGQYLVYVDAGAHGTAASDEWSAPPGSAVTLTATPDAGYHLDSWQVTEPSDGSVTVGSDATFTMPAGDVTVKATFAANTYTVTYNGNGADGGSMTDSSFVYDTAAALAGNAFVREDSQFSGWATSATGPVAYADGASVKNLTAVNGATVTLYAVWTTAQSTAGSWSSLPGGFITDTFHLPPVRVSDAVNQPLVGLWDGVTPTGFTKVSGDSWLSVSSTGVVTGTAPATAPQNGGTITVSATNGTTTSQILVEVAVYAAKAAPQLTSASWNAWSGGSNVTDAVGKNLAVIAAQGIDVIGFQDGGAAMAQQVAAALGWRFYGAGDLGIVSAYPIAQTGRVAATTAAPAAAVTISVDGQSVRVWDAYLDETASDTAARTAQAQAIVAEIHSDVAAAGTTPMVLLGDLGTSALAGSFTAAGLTDSFRVDNPDATAAPGVTWPLFPTAGVTADRIDYVDFAGALHVQASQTLTVGWPSATTPASNSWASDHAAVLTLFTVGDGSSTTSPPAPVVSVATDTVAYQVGHGPANGAAVLAQVGATTDPSDATVAIDLSAVDFTTAGWYTALVTATSDGYVSDPVAVTVRVAPVPTLTLGATTAGYKVGDSVDEPGVLAQLLPALDVPGSVRVDLTGVNSSAPGSYPVTVTATDEWGFKVTASATVVLTGTAATTGVVAGTVTSAQGAKQLGNICVYLYPHGTSSAAAFASCTQSNGGYEIDGVTPGSYDVAFSDPAGGYLTQWHNGTAAGVSSQAQATPVTVTAAGPNRIDEALTAVPAGNLTGVVTDALTGTPAANVCVYLYPHGNPAAAVYATCTAADGSYAIYGATPAGYDVAFFDPTGAHVTQWSNGTGTGSATQAGAVAVAVASGNQTTGNVNAALALVPTGNVSGAVTDASTAAPVSNVCVYLYQDGVSSSAAYATCTGGDGRWSLGDVAAGKYEVAFADPAGSYTTQWRTGAAAGAATQAGAQAITVAAGNSSVTGVDAALALVGSSVVQGTVTAALDGTPLANICVYLYQDGVNSSAAYATCTGADGTYTVPAVAAGGYDVAFFDPAGVYATQWHTTTAAGSPNQAGAQAITVTGGNKAVTVAAALSPVSP